MTERIVIRQGARILTPKEYYKLRDNLDPNIGYRLIADCLLHSGLRVVEFWAVVDNPHWYHSSSRVIDLPKEGASKKMHGMKPRSVITERTVRLTEAGCKAFDTLFAAGVEFRERDAMGNALKRAAVRVKMNPKGITPKMFRKMLASWLVECRDDLHIDSLDITASLGHTEDILRKHYLGVGFSPEAHTDIVAFLRGWKT